MAVRGEDLSTLEAVNKAAGYVFTPIPLGHFTHTGKGTLNDTSKLTNERGIYVQAFENKDGALGPFYGGKAAGQEGYSGRIPREYYNSQNES